MYESLVGRLRELVAEVRERSLPGDEAMRFVQLFTEVERLGAAGRTLASRQVDQSKSWQSDGHRSSAHWIAATTGTTVGQARATLETARHLEDLPLTKDAFCRGQLSEVQTREISGAAHVDPRAERSLLASASHKTVQGLREECQRVRAASASDEQARYEAIHRTRY